MSPYLWCSESIESIECKERKGAELERHHSDRYTRKSDDSMPEEREEGIGYNSCGVKSNVFI